MSQQRIPVNIVAGPLGVGKTTTINHLLKQRPDNEHWAILVNEYGLVGLDAALMVKDPLVKNSAGVEIKELVILRHTWACLALVATNGNIKLVKDEGGWKTYKMVERYAQYNEKNLRKGTEVIGNYLARAKA